MKKIKQIPKTQSVLEVLVLGEDKKFKIARITNTNEYVLYAVSPRGEEIYCLGKSTSPIVLEKKANEFDWESI